MLESLIGRIHDQIPLTRAMEFSFSSYKPGELCLRAPLEGHVNDKGTFFAGSQAALFTLAGWALTTLEAESRFGPSDVVAVENELKYTAPLTGDMVITVTAELASLKQFAGSIERRGKAPLAVSAQGTSERGDLVSSWKGLYLARLIRKE